VEESTLKFALTAFTTLLVVVDPFGVLPIFVFLLANHNRAERARVIRRAVFIGFAIALGFLLAGHSMLSYLGVTVHAFSISGGLLLFATAMPMLFGQRPAMQSSESNEQGPEDVSIFPLAIPILAGPGTITSILLLTSQARGDTLRLGALLIVLTFVFVVSWAILGLASERLVRRLGTGGVHIATRVLGILLAALAVQFVLNGVTEYVHLLRVAT
jgi:multiple antibiotic resistance protein